MKAEEIVNRAVLDAGGGEREQRIAQLEDEIERLRAIVETAQQWRRAYHHGTRKEIELQEQCLLDALDATDEQQAPCEHLGSIVRGVCTKCGAHS